MPHDNHVIPSRRRLLQGSAALGGLGLLGGCATTGAPMAEALARRGQRIPLAPIRASTDRLFDITVCLRPFRAAGPRIETERVGDKLVVHNYGHGGSGWSLSWGSGALAVGKAMAASPTHVAVIGCGALGLTSAIQAQQAGAEVTIYARDLLPATRSARATGSWTPSSRIALESKVDPGFPAMWEEMARTSFKTYRRYLGLPGSPVEWNDRYNLHDPDGPQHMAPATRVSVPGALDFADYEDRIADLEPRFEDIPEAVSPFPGLRVRRTSSMMFNIADYGHTLMSDFFAAGGHFVRTEFHSPADLAAIKEPVIINCPGYGARALWKDESIVPVRGQIGWLVPQPEANYGLYYNGVSVLSRRDGIVVQVVAGGDMKGYGDDNETPIRAESESGVKAIADLYSRIAALS